MIKLSIFLQKYLSLLAAAGKPIGFLTLLVFLLGNALWVIGYPANSYPEAIGISFSTFLSLGSPDHDKFIGGLRVLELLIEVLGLVLFAIFTSAAIKSLERAKIKGERRGG